MASCSVWPECCCRRWFKWSRVSPPWGEFIKNGDITGALNELINIPANTTNAFLNGAGVLDLTSIAKQLVPDLPAESIGLQLGGLLNTVPINGTVGSEFFPPTEFSGGTGFDAVATKVSLGSVGVEFYGLRNGWAGSVVGLSQFLGEKMLVTPPADIVAPTAAAAVAPKAAAAAVVVPAVPATPATPAVPATDEAPATPAIPATPAVAEAPEAPAAADTPSHRGGGHDKSDNGSPAKGHRGAA